MIRVGVLRGGTSNRYDESLRTGAYVLKQLPRDMYEPIDIFVDRGGVWHLGGAPVSYDKLRHRVDIIWNALHGFYGEDGRVQQLLENLAIPYTGAGPLASSMTMNKKIAKDTLAGLGIKTPRGMYIESWGGGDREETVESVAQNIAQQFSPPWIVEAISRGQTNGPMRAKTRDELVAVLFQMFDLSIPILIEEAVLGTEVSVVASSGFRSESVYTFLPEHREEGRARVRAPASDELQLLAKKIHEHFDLGKYSRTEAVVTPKGTIYVLGVDTVPALYSESKVHDMFASTGVTFREFAKHMIEGVFIPKGK